MAVGASTCASGSQVWNGNAGILIAKPTKSATQRTTCTSSGILSATSAPELRHVEAVRVGGEVEVEER